LNGIPLEKENSEKNQKTIRDEVRCSLPNMIVSTHII
jgi:hypothetical protein